MTILSRRFKLEYNDAVDGTTVIAETGQDTGALKIDRHAQIRRSKDPDILKLWLEGSNFGEEVPTRKTEFGQAQNETDEPEILYKQYNPDTDSFVTQGRYYAKNTGTINENGQLSLKLYSFHKFTARQQVDTPTTTTNVEDALNSVLPAGYVADVPAGATPPSVDGYSINARREKGYHELTRDYKWTLTFTGELDANNDYKVKYEPEGFGGTVDTIIENTQASRYRITAVDTTNNTFTVQGDRTNELVVNQAILVLNSTGNDGTYTISNLSYDSNTNTTTISVDENVSNSTADGAIIPGGQAVFKTWEKDKTDSIINKVLVEGTRTSDGQKITATATNQAQIDNFGEKFLKVKRGYVESVTDAENIAESYLVPGKDENGDDITTVPENGTVKTTAYSDNIVNDSMQVVGNKRNIEDTYTVAQQRNYWPEGATEIEFEFEKENLEEAARESENLRDERGRLYPDGQEDVGNQNFTGDTGDARSNTAKIGGVGDFNDRDNDFSNVARGTGGVLDDGGSMSLIADDSQTINQTATPGATLPLSDNTISIDAAANKHIFFELDTDTAGADFDVVMDIAGFEFQRVRVATSENGVFKTVYPITGDVPVSSVSVDVEFTNRSGGDVFINSGAFEVYGEEVHQHNDDINPANNAMGLTDNIGTDDNFHGGGTDDDQHGTSGSTDAKNIQVINEDKTDR